MVGFEEAVQRGRRRRVAARVVEVPGAGHWLVEEAPASVTAEPLALLAG